MAEIKIKKIYKKRAAISISKIAFYIKGKGYSITAKKITGKLYKFGNFLADFPDKYPVCRNRVWGEQNLRCAIF